MRVIFLTKNCLAGGLFFLTACSKGDGSSPDAPPDLEARISKIVQTKNGNVVNDTLLLAYNPDGTVHQIKHFLEGDPDYLVEFNHQTDYTVREQTFPSGNSHGYIVRDSFRLDAQDRPLEDYHFDQYRYQSVQKYFYRSDGKLDYTVDPRDAGTSGKLQYIWEGGDHTKTEITGMLALTYTYFADKSARPGDAQMITDLLQRGKVLLPNTHLLNASKFLKEVPAQYSYTYAGGRIATVTRTNEIATGTVVQTLTYEN